MHDKLPDLSVNTKYLLSINKYKEFLCKYFRIDEVIDITVNPVKDKFGTHRSPSVVSSINIDNLWSRICLLQSRLAVNRLCQADKSEAERINSKMKVLAHAVLVVGGTDPLVDFLRNNGVLNAQISDILDLNNVSEVETYNEFPAGHIMSNVTKMTPGKLKDRTRFHQGVRSILDEASARGRDVRQLTVGD